MSKWDTIFRLGTVGAVLLLLFSGNRLYEFYVEYDNGKNKYEEIREEAVIVSPYKENGGKVTADLQKVINGNQEIVGIDFPEITQTNDNIIGWILFEEPAQINYPIVQGIDNQEYLQKTLDADGYKYGTIFMDYENASDFSDPNTIIYGHHMANGTMFAQLLKYEDVNFYQQYPFFYIYTPDGTALGRLHRYRIFSAERAADGGPGFQIHFNRENTFSAYITYLKQNSLYDTGVEPGKNDKVVTLSTCSGGVESERFLVHGILVQ